MSEEVNIKKAERQVFKAAFSDGLWDIVIAGLLLQFAIAPLLSLLLGDFWSSAVFVPFIILLVITIWLLRRYIVKPRMGVVKFGKSRVRRLKKFTIVMLVINVLALIMGLVGSLVFDILSGQIITITFSVTFITGFSLTAYFLDYPRLYIYGLLVGAAPYVGEWLYTSYGFSHHGFPITFGFASGVIFLIALTTFIRFMCNNPVMIKDASQGS